jgi:hypothetical protein
MLVAPRPYEISSPERREVAAFRTLTTDAGEPSQLRYVQRPVLCERQEVAQAHVGSEQQRGTVLVSAERFRGCTSEGRRSIEACVTGSQDFA